MMVLILMRSALIKSYLTAEINQYLHNFNYVQKVLSSFLAVGTLPWADSSLGIRAGGPAGRQLHKKGIGLA